MHYLELPCAEYTMFPSSLLNVCTDDVIVWPPKAMTTFTTGLHQEWFDGNLLPRDSRNGLQLPARILAFQLPARILAKYVPIS